MRVAKVTVTLAIRHPSLALDPRPRLSRSDPQYCIHLTQIITPETGNELMNDQCGWIDHEPSTTIPKLVAQIVPARGAPLLPVPEAPLESLP